jgi:hypothetical protein
MILYISQFCYIFPASLSLDFILNSPSLYLFLSLSSSKIKWGTFVGFPYLSKATIVTNAVAACTLVLSSRSSASTFTSISMEDLRTYVILAEIMSAFPTKTGFRNTILSILAVTTFALPECLLATKPAIRSTCFSITPPKTFPLGLASEGNIITIISASDSVGCFPLSPLLTDKTIDPILLSLYILNTSKSFYCHRFQFFHLINAFPIVPPILI